MMNLTAPLAHPQGAHSEICWTFRSANKPLLRALNYSAAHSKKRWNIRSVQSFSALLPAVELLGLYLCQLSEEWVMLAHRGSG